MEIILIELNPAIKNNPVTFDYNSTKMLTTYNSTLIPIPGDIINVPDKDGDVTYKVTRRGISVKNSDVIVISVEKEE